MQALDSIRGCWLEINLDDLSHNIQKIINHIDDKNTIINIVLKANGNGHGAIRVAQTAIENGIKYFSVAIIDEAIELRRSGILNSLQILGLTPRGRINEIIKYNLEPTIDTYEDAKAISESARQAGNIINIHIKINTGLNRIGFQPGEESIKEIRDISLLKNIKISSIFTHFATSDIKDKTFTKMQYSIFNTFCSELENLNIHIPLKHAANSAAIVDHKYTYMNMVRTGTLLYGFYPSSQVSQILNLREVASFKAKIVHIHKIIAGDSVGYGRLYRTDKPMKIAVIPVGYADGYPRDYSDKAMVICNGILVPIIGRICMDQTIIDVTKLHDVNINDEVVLYGQQGEEIITFDDAAKIIGTINIDISSRISRRVPRVYIKDGKIIEIKNYLYD